MAALIWDMDGTLVDSYPVIVPAVKKVCEEMGLFFSRDYIYRELIRTSVGDFIQTHVDEKNRETARARFNVLNDSNIDAILPVAHAAETLTALTEAGNRCFVFTHRGASCRGILEHTGLLSYFTEIVTALDGFPRKPAPDAILYLMKKYALDPDCTFYVGDRSLDIEAANNAGIGSILYLPPASPGAATGRETHIVPDLLKIPEICSEKAQ